METIVLFVVLHSPWLVGWVLLWSMVMVCLVLWRRTHSRAGALWLMPAFIAGLIGLGCLQLVVSEAARFPKRYAMAITEGYDLLRDFPYTNVFPTGTMAKKVATGMTLKQVSEVMAFADVGLICGPRHDGGKVAKYVFFSTDPIYGEAVVVLFDSNDEAVLAWGVDSYDPSIGVECTTI